MGKILQPGKDGTWEWRMWGWNTIKDAVHDFWLASLTFPDKRRVGDSHSFFQRNHQKNTHKHKLLWPSLSTKERPPAPPFWLCHPLPWMFQGNKGSCYSSFCKLQQSKLARDDERKKEKKMVGIPNVMFDCTWPLLLSLIPPLLSLSFSLKLAQSYSQKTSMGSVLTWGTSHLYPTQHCSSFSVWERVYCPCSWRVFPPLFSLELHGPISFIKQQEVHVKRMECQSQFWCHNPKPHD